MRRRRKWSQRAQFLELESVHELVTQYVGVLTVSPGEGKDDSVADAFRHATFAEGDDAGNDIGLFEVDEGVIENHFLGAFDLIAEEIFVVCIPLLKHSCGVLNSLRTLGVVIDLEVIGFQH